MSAETQLIDNILHQVKQLPPDSRLRLIQRITETLLPPTPQQTKKPLQYGKYKGQKMSRLEDFAIAEWRPTDESY